MTTRRPEPQGWREHAPLGCWHLLTAERGEDGVVTHVQRWTSSRDRSLREAQFVIGHARKIVDDWRVQERAWMNTVVLIVEDHWNGRIDDDAVGLEWISDRDY